MGRLSPKIWQAVTALVEGFAQLDFDLMAQGLIRMGATSGEVNDAQLAVDLEVLFQRLQTLDPQVVLARGPEGVAAAVTVDEEQVRQGRRTQARGMVVSGFSDEVVYAGLWAPQPPVPR